MSGSASNPGSNGLNSSKRRDRFRAREPSNGRNTPRSLEIKKNLEKKKRHVPLKNQIRSIERLLKKDLPDEMRVSQERKLSELKALLDEHQKHEIEKKMAIRYRKVKFFERRKIERRLRRVEKQLRNLSENETQTEPNHQNLVSSLNDQLIQLKEDLEYVQFFPKTERYISLFVSQDDPNAEAKRNEMRKRIKENILSAKARGQELEETGSEDDGMLDLSDDEFFIGNSSGDEAHADDELGDDTSLDNNHMSAPNNQSHAIHPRPSNSQHRTRQNHSSNSHNASRDISERDPSQQLRFGRPPLPRRGTNLTSQTTTTHLLERRGERSHEDEDGEVPSRNMMPPPGTRNRLPEPQGRTQGRDADILGVVGANSVGGSSSSQVEDSNENIKKKRKRTRPKKKRS